jgi:LCP family protein required for cell wall assembly
MRPSLAFAAAVFTASCLASCTSTPSSPNASTAPPSSAASAAPTPTASPSPAPVPELSFRIASVAARGVGSELHGPALSAATDHVTEALDRLYTIGFLDPVAWDRGRFTSLFRSFEADVREQAHRDLGELSLGRSWRIVDAVRPTRASAELRFIGDAAGRPILALADVTFGATARRGDERGEIAQTGRLVLRRSRGTWRVAGYAVRARVPSSLEARARAIDVSFAPGVPATRPVVLLVIGSDARPHQAVAATRADSLHLVGVEPRSGRVSVLGIPRDSWVSIPGRGTDKINASLADGGPDLVVRTVERLTGVHVDAYVLTGFDGFVRGVAAIGGIDIDIPYAITDRYAHARFRPGRAHLGGKAALAFARARHALPHGDFDRSLNQGRLLLAALSTLRSEVRHGSEALVRWTIAAHAYVRTDLSLADLFELLVAALSFDPSQARNRVATGRVATIGGKSVVLLDAGAYASFRDLARDGVLGG